MAVKLVFCIVPAAEFCQRRSIRPSLPNACQDKEKSLPWKD
jgi:hypothetical protein